MEGSERSDWERCQERFPLLPECCLQCVKYFSPGSQAVSSVGKLGNFGKGKAKVEAKQRAVGSGEMGSDQTTLMVSQCPGPLSPLLLLRHLVVPGSPWDTSVSGEEKAVPSSAN